MNPEPITTITGIPKPAEQKQEASQAKASKAKEEEEDIVFDSKEETFIACLDEGNLDDILTDADEWMFHIGQNIQALAEFFNEENPYVITGNEPEWMLELFKSNNVAIEG